MDSFLNFFQTVFCRGICEGKRWDIAERGVCSFFTENQFSLENWAKTTLERQSSGLCGRTSLPPQNIIVLNNFIIASYIDRVPYFSYLLETRNIFSHLMQIWQLFMVIKVARWMLPNTGGVHSTSMDMYLLYLLYI